MNKMCTFIKKKLPSFYKNCLGPTYKKPKPRKSAFIKNSSFEINRDPWSVYHSHFSLSVYCCSVYVPFCLSVFCHQIVSFCLSSSLFIFCSSLKKGGRKLEEMSSVGFRSIQPVLLLRVCSPKEEADLKNVENIHVPSSERGRAPSRALRGSRSAN